MSSDRTVSARQAMPMLISRDIAVPMRDGSILRANLFRPDDGRRYPVIVSSTPYGKDVHVRDSFPPVWGTVEARYPEILEASSGAHMIWECPDPEIWVGNGYAMLQVDVRGTGKSAGYMQPNSPAEADDGYDAIEWAVAQDWCDGSAGMLGLGYITCTNWRIAALKPAGLKAAVFCQGTHDFYRDRIRNDGIYSSGFNSIWWKVQGLANQHGNPDSPFPDMYTGGVATGPERLSPAELAANRIDYLEELLAHPLLDDWFKARIANLAKIDVPALVIANWGGLGLQLRGTVTGWTGLGSRHKWLKIESGSYFFTFFTPERVAFLKKFFDCHLKGIENGWTSVPRVEVTIRSTDDGVAGLVKSTDWPLPELQWRRLYFDLQSRALVETPPTAATTAGYTPGSNEVTLSTEPLPETVTLAGPLAAKLWLSCETEDTDLFLTVRIIAPDGKDVSFFAAVDPHSAPAQGWLRASQRKLDPKRSSEYLLCHAHDERQPLRAGEIYEVDVSIWPTGIEIPAGHRLALVIGGADFTWPPESGKRPSVFVHNEPRDRPAAVYEGKVTLHSGVKHPAYIALPCMPKPTK